MGFVAPSNLCPISIHCVVDREGMNGLRGRSPVRPEEPDKLRKSCLLYRTKKDGIVWVGHVEKGLVCKDDFPAFLEVCAHESLVRRKQS
jgi:hypothetical protein